MLFHSSFSISTEKVYKTLEAPKTINKTINKDDDLNFSFM